MARAKRHYLPGHICHITHRASGGGLRWKREEGRGKMEDGSNCPPLWGRREKTEKNLGRMENKMRFPKQFLFDIIRKWGHELGPDLLTMKLMER
jgi:hypothetical protein